MPEDIANVEIPEIEITPDMIKAGVSMYHLFHAVESGDPEEAVIAIFECMVSASNQFNPADRDEHNAARLKLSHKNI